MRRVTFNEITKKAVKAAFPHARDVDENLVDAQQTRRVLDRLVGYQISPLLWDKVRRGLSAGRVQTVALRLIVEREQEINEFKPVEYWTVDAVLESGEGRAGFHGAAGWRLTASRCAWRMVTDKDGKEQFLANALPDKEAVDEVVAQLEQATWTRARCREEGAAGGIRQAPYTTSKLQQDASSRLGFNVRRTMGVAQRLYEGVEIGDGWHGRSDYLYAYRFDACVAGCDCGGAGVYRQAGRGSICRRSRTSMQARSRSAGAGCARSDSADECELIRRSRFGDICQR